MSQMDAPQHYRPGARARAFLDDLTVLCQRHHLRLTLSYDAMELRDLDDFHAPLDDADFDDQLAARALPAREHTHDGG
jgi:hypothetical protein